MEINNNYALRIPAAMRSQPSSSLVADDALLTGTTPSPLPFDIDLDGPHANLHKALAASFVHGHQLSTLPPAPGQLSPALQAASDASEVINPADWITQSDVKLFEKTTGFTIKDGEIVDKDGNAVDDQDASDTLSALYDMRNHGTFSANGNLKLVIGDISAEDLQGYIDHYLGSTAVNTDVLDNALEVLQSEQSDV